MTRKTIIPLAAALVLVAGCSPQLEDRGGEEGAPPDFIGDVDYVEVYRNADDFPNVARVCVRGLAFATTSTGRGHESVGATPIIRVAEWDDFCRNRVAHP
ncbi:hypothetical protein HUO13_27190 [Saccharopolyspora erythraea]|uniref:hypothetical protein n=1 Tax=Saccharopolyspora erythraea TaxID=1836 RepID=UPI001BA9C9EA|nr:hypothetical protein [Saccharopolyspora erythraea]QUH04012.1 hypothetical protein HUO13_27190 [Saccharopolyspora erythraea]